MSSNYDEFAAVYNRHWAGASLAWFPQLERLVLDKLHPKCDVLDVACGTGQFAEKLTRQGFRTVGIDASFEMLRYAAVNAPRCKLVCADIRRFCLSHKFDAAFSLFDSLNHLLTWTISRRRFLNVSGCLAPGGCSPST